MTNLTDQQVGEVSADIQQRYSAVLAEIPVSKTQLHKWLRDTVDVEVEAAELAVFQNTPVGAAKDWLQANPVIGRDMLEAIVEKRKEVL